MRKLGLVVAIGFALLAARSDPALAAGNTITTVASLGGDSALILDASGNAVIAYRSSADARLKVLHCDDPFCAPGGDSLTSPDTELGQWPSIALDGLGNPVISYYTTYFDRLKLLHCNDPNCAGLDDSITTPDPGVFLLESPTSLQLDASGFPVIAYAPPYELRVLHCNDLNCAGDNESITAHDINVAAPSLALDGSGNPVVAYYKSVSGNYTVGALKVMHCNDANCAGANEAVQSPDAAGITPSLALDASGRPVIAYYSGTSTRDLKVMHCNEANCAGANESITTADTMGDVGVDPWLRLASGNPLVTYRDATNGDLKLLRCIDANCTPGTFTPIQLDADGDAGGESSLLVDGAGHPAVTYDAGATVRLLRCGTFACGASVGGLTELAAATDGGRSARTAPVALAAFLAGTLAIGGLTLYRYVRSRRS